MKSDAPTRSLRRRIAGLILLVGALYLGHRFFDGPSVVPVEIHYRLGASPPVRILESRFVSGTGAVVAQFRTELVGPDVKHTPRMPEGRYDVDVTLSRTDGTQVSTRRTVEASRNAMVTMELGDLAREATEPRP